MALLRASLDYGVQQLGFDADAFVHELTDSIIGDNYPVPDRMLRALRAHRRTTTWCRRCATARPPRGRYDLFAVEGGTAAMCYIFDSLVQNRLLKPGDTIALGTPVFTPYLEIPHLDRYRFKVVHVEATEIAKAGYHTWQYPDGEIDKLADPKIKSVLRGQSEQPAVGGDARPAAMKRLVKLVKTKRPDLMVVDRRRVRHLRRTASARSWPSCRATPSASTRTPSTSAAPAGGSGVVAIHQKNIFDDMLGEAARDRARKRSTSATARITLQPEKLKFIDRMVADSRQVALNHTAGLSLPQQVQMALFSLFALLDTDDALQEAHPDHRRPPPAQARGGRGRRSCGTIRSRQLLLDHRPAQLGQARVRPGVRRSLLAAASSLRSAVRPGRARTAWCC